MPLHLQMLSSFERMGTDRYRQPGRASRSFCKFTLALEWSCLWNMLGSSLMHDMLRRIVLEALLYLASVPIVSVSVDGHSVMK